MRDSPGHMLITAGPTHEPIDAVRFIGNRSSGRLGVALADAATEAGWRVTLALGPVERRPRHESVELVRFTTVADLAALLGAHQPRCDVLVMAAAVADYRPLTDHGRTVKLRRTGERMVLELEPTPDLLAACAARRRAGQLIVGFALEPQAELLQSARGKLERKGADLIVANPLETMDSPRIDAVVIGLFGFERATRGAVDKAAFGPWLLDVIEEARRAPTTPV